MNSLYTHKKSCCQANRICLSKIEPCTTRQPAAKLHSSTSFVHYNKAIKELYAKQVGFLLNSLLESQSI